MRVLQATVFSMFVLLTQCLFSSSVYAADDPVALLRGVAERISVELEAKRSRLDKEPELVYNIAERYLVPYCDFEYMSQWVAGRSAWRNASSAEQAEFINAFKTLVLRTYAGTLRRYNNQEIEFLPLRASDQGKQRVQVQSYIKEPGKEKFSLVYRMVRSGSSWKIYDLIPEGVSLLKGFQNQFAADARANGLRAVTTKIRAHNNRGDS